MTDLSAAYALNTTDNFFGDGDGYTPSPSSGMSVTAVPVQNVASTTPRPSLDVNHHFAVIIVALAAILYASHHIGLRGVVAQ